MALLFEKPSLRTRVSFEAGMIHLGGSSLFLGDDVGFGARESMADFGRVLSQYVDVIVVRAFQHKTSVDLARYCSCSVINGLTDDAHPCQALADLYTLKEIFGRLAAAARWPTSATATTWPAAWPRAAARWACGSSWPRPRAIASTGVSRAAQDRRARSSTCVVTADPAEAVREATAVYTDVWTSMGQETEAAAGAKISPLSGQCQADGRRAARKRSSCTACRPIAARK